MTPKHYALALYELTKDAGSDTDRVVDEFVEALAEEGKTYLLGSILKQYRVLLLKKNELPEVTVRSAEKIDKKIEEEILEALKIPEGVTVRREVDKSILGGIFVKFNNRVMDFSLKRKLGRLQSRLERNH